MAITTGSTSGFCPINLHTIGQVKGVIEANRDLETNLFASLKAAVNLKPHKIIVGINESDSKNLKNQDFEYLSDQLADSYLNLSVTNLTSGPFNESTSGLKLVAEKLIKLNGNPFNKIIDHGNSRHSGSLQVT